MFNHSNRWKCSHRSNSKATLSYHSSIFLQRKVNFNKKELQWLSTWILVSWFWLGFGFCFVLKYAGVDLGLNQQLREGSWERGHRIALLFLILFTPFLLIQVLLEERQKQGRENAPTRNSRAHYDQLRYAHLSFLKFALKSHLHC